MNLLVPLITAALLLVPVYAQSGRRVKDRLPPAAPPAEIPKEPGPVVPAKDVAPPVTAERNQDYRCSDDGTLARIIDDEVQPASILSSKEVDSRAVIITKPKPGYTRDARRMGVQGYVILRVGLSSNGKIDRVRVVRGLPGGLTENGIKAACKIEFKPALKEGQPVSQWLNVEYVFRLADSSIFKP
ncbi:MAG: energy transducer TonB [Pyrinomonadaceae bacterium]